MLEPIQQAPAVRRDVVHEHRWRNPCLPGRVRQYVWPSRAQSRQARRLLTGRPVKAPAACAPTSANRHGCPQDLVPPLACRFHLSGIADLRDCRMWPVHQHESCRSFSEQMRCFRHQQHAGGAGGGRCGNDYRNCATRVRLVRAGTGVLDHAQRSCRSGSRHCQLHRRRQPQRYVPAGAGRRVGAEPRGGAGSRGVPLHGHAVQRGRRCLGRRCNCQRDLARRMRLARADGCSPG